MAGLLAWAADVVGGAGAGSEEEDEIQLPLLVFTPEQQQRALELDRMATTLRRSIQDLRLRIPPEDISQRLPHLHAHTIASSASLALQLDAHSTTREQAQSRELSLQDENATYEKAISSCQKKIQEKKNEVSQLQSRLEELDVIETDLNENLEKIEAEVKFSQSSVISNRSNNEEQVDLVGESSVGIKSKELQEKKAELNSLKEMVHRLEEEWSLVEQEAMKKPSPAQREKALEKQLHSLLEQLTTKQAQAESLVSEMRTKGKELEKLNNMQRELSAGSTDAATARNRFSRSTAGLGPSHADHDLYLRPSSAGARATTLQKLMLLKSAFVLYILALHVIVFIKISF